ncbi:25175_t:CDS:1 [Gigaspora margarita]|uniref:25175_t:CDS:1 n=1 Tax=Gigaspora margarita TaxID=4874 RepID=A0ABM8W4I6_GIGMA|nr:25175_t:CDS:1 [Gigaspora margarita]
MVKFIQSEKEKQITSKANIRGVVKNFIHFSVNDKKYAIIINKIARLYTIRLVNYEDEGEYKVKITAVKRFPDLVGFYQTKEEAYNHAKVIKEEQKVDQCKYEFETQEDNAENILIIGRTGSGKSALANVISNSDEFGESEGSVSKTKNFQIKIFEWGGVKYRVVDTVGVADTKLPPKKVLFKLAEAIHSMKGGIKQVLAVIGGRFTQEEIEAFDLLIAIFGKNGTKHTTIIRSRFENFRSFEKCEEDRKVLFKTLENESKKVSNLVNSCKGIIYINNPQLGSNERRRKIDEEDRRDS